MRDGYRPFLPTVARTEKDQRELVVLVSAHWLPGGARRRTNLPVVIDHPPVWPPVRRGRAGRIALLAALVAIPAMMAAWFGWQFASARKAAPQVRVAAMPDVEIDLPEPPPLKASAVPVPPASTKVAAPPAKVVERDKVEPSPKLLNIAALPEVQTAVRGAFVSGVAVPWAARGLQGYAVAGPIQVDDGHACRNVAIWAKSDGGKGATISARKCIAEGGAWVDVEQPLQAVDVPEPGEDAPN